VTVRAALVLALVLTVVLVTPLAAGAQYKAGKVPRVAVAQPTGFSITATTS
jgi:hypothetical protein